MNPDDALIAEKLFGWKWWHGCEYEPDETTVMGKYSLLCSPDGFESWAEAFGMSRPEYAGGNKLAQCLPAYTSDAAADALVLAKVRETWNEQQRMAFSRALCKLCRIRQDVEFSTQGIVLLLCDHLEPGMFSKAALAVLATSKEGE